jgi:membrane associated rhomboid family serine protease
MMNITPVVKQLLIINIIFFIGTQFVPIAETYFALYYFENPAFKAWQPLTHMFMHGNLMHIAFNMFALYSFGSNLEYIWGSKKFLFFYLSCGLGAALIHTAANYYQFHEGLNVLIENGYNKAEILKILAEGKYDQQWTQLLGQSDFSHFIQSYMVPAVGASGAIYGLLAAFAFMFPNAELLLFFIPVPVKAKYFVPILVLLDLFSGITGSSVMGGGIAHFAHVGGALFGILMVWFWKKNQFNKNRWN